MKPPLSKYEDPCSLDDVRAVLAAGGAEVSILSGGQSLMPVLLGRLRRRP